MSEETVITLTPAMRKRTWIIRGVLWSFVILVFSLVTGCSLLIETPIHFLAGWVFHGMKTLPPLLGNWRMILLPAGCLVLAGVLVHRFVRRSLDVKGGPLPWRAAHTMASLALILLGSGAAIALSGIVHQSVWLMSDPWTEDRSRKTELTFAMSNARQLMMALMEYREEMGNYPNSFQELETELNVPPQLAWVQTGNRKVPEPFILLHPGSKRLMYMDEPVIVSPVIPRYGRIVVGYADTSVKSLPANQFDSILKGGGKRSFETTPKP